MLNLLSILTAIVVCVIIKENMRTEKEIYKKIAQGFGMVALLLVIVLVLSTANAVFYSI
jgi:hypothetical protein